MYIGIEGGNMERRVDSDKDYLFFNKLLEIPWLVHGFSTRNKGVSKDSYKSMNLRFNSNDSKKNINNNYKKFLSWFSLKPQNVLQAKQVHGSRILKAVRDHTGEILLEGNSQIGYDGIITDEDTIGLMTFHADCVPVFFVDSKRKVIGLVHSGWKGTLNQINIKMLNLFLEEYESDLSDVLVALGPSIGGCCYEVGEELYQKFIQVNNSYQKFFSVHNTGKYHLDLQLLIEFDLLSFGIPRENISISGMCTKCNPELFFSHRAHGDKRGGMAALLGKK